MSVAIWSRSLKLWRGWQGNGMGARTLRPTPWRAGIKGSQEVTKRLSVWMNGYFWSQPAWLGALGCQGKKLSCVISPSTFHCLWHFQICFWSQGHWRPNGMTGTWVRKEREAKKRSIWSQAQEEGLCQFCSTLSGGSDPSGALCLSGSNTDHDKKKHPKNGLLRSWGFGHCIGGGINVKTGRFLACRR